MHSLPGSCDRKLSTDPGPDSPPRRLRGGPPESAPADAAGTLTPAVLTSPLSARRPARTPCKPRRHGSDFRFRPARALFDSLGTYFKHCEDLTQEVLGSSPACLS
ncbi:CDGSH iron-sulfur domain-containing protein 1 isoform X5 [Dipodomys merriami]|uniref:CDGSH iron-sulfur domain-containing protein 1 isoform X5 n=1 Tax=Dipodomys merriami TaxID=94247 RepID=UPI003855774A